MSYPPAAAVLPQHLLDGARLLSSRYALLPLLPKAATFVEVGVGLGDFSHDVIATCRPARFVAIDDFRLHELDTLWGRPTSAIFGERSHAMLYRERFAGEVDSGRLQILEGGSAECLDRLEDASVDIIYIDAGHLYEDVRRDLTAALPKIRGDGWIILNDYIMVAELGGNQAYGVVNATNEFMIEHDWGIQYFALERLMFCDVALRPRRAIENPQSALAALQADGARLAAEIACLRQSTSWRATGPLRAAVQAARTLAGRRLPGKVS